MLGSLFFKILRLLCNQSKWLHHRVVIHFVTCYLKEGFDGTQSDFIACYIAKKKLGVETDNELINYLRTRRIIKTCHTVRCTCANIYNKKRMRFFVIDTINESVCWQLTYSQRDNISYDVMFKFDNSYRIHYPAIAYS